MERFSFGGFRHFLSNVGSYRHMALGVVLGAVLFPLGYYFGTQSQSRYRSTSLLVVPDHFDVSSDSSTNRFVLEFPDKIPSALHVDRYITLHAANCLVHIRQAHRGNEENKEMWRERVVNVQNDISTIISFLVKNQGITCIYNEGFIRKPRDLPPDLAFKVEEGRVFLSYKSPSDHSATVRYDTCVRGLEKEVQGYIDRCFSPESRLHFPNLPHKTEFSIAETELVETSLKTAVTQYDTENFAYSALERHFVSGKVSVYTAEKLAPYLSSGIVLHLLKSHGIDYSTARVSSPEISALFLDKREDAVLDLVAQKTLPIAVVVYGGAHAFGGEHSFGPPYPLHENRFSFRDNISDWNAKHPDKSFSLIEITPQHYEH